MASTRVPARPWPGRIWSPMRTSTSARTESRARWACDPDGRGERGGRCRRAVELVHGPAERSAEAGGHLPLGEADVLGAGHGPEAPGAVADRRHAHAVEAGGRQLGRRSGRPRGRCAGASKQRVGAVRADGVERRRLQEEVRLLARALVQVGAEVEGHRVGQAVEQGPDQVVAQLAHGRRGGDVDGGGLGGLGTADDLRDGGSTSVPAAPPARRAASASTGAPSRASTPLRRRAASLRPGRQVSRSARVGMMAARPRPEPALELEVLVEVVDVVGLVVDGVALEAGQGVGHCAYGTKRG